MATGTRRAAGEQGGTVPGSLPPGSQTFGRTLPAGVQASGHILDAPSVLVRLRLMALDATVMDVPDTPENVRPSQAPHPEGESAWPQIRLVAISECSTHAVCEAGVWPHDFDERAAGLRLLARGAGAGMLVLWDRGFHSFEMVKARSPAEPIC